MKGKKVLVISSADPSKGAGAIGMDMYNAIKDYGVDADMLTLYKPDECPEVNYVYEKPIKYKNFLFKLSRKFWKFSKPNFFFFYRKESLPPVNVSDVLKKITKQYDVVVVYFWQELLSFKTIEKIYDKLHCKFVFICADYSPMTGGCHFTGDCERYKFGCGCCPAFNSNNANDFTYWNVQYRKKVYDKVRPIIWANTYMIESFFKKSYLLKNQILVHGKGFMDLNFFKEYPLEDVRVKYEIPLEKKILIAFGCQSLTDERKGMSYLFEALDIVYNSLTNDERENVLVISIGRNGSEIKNKIRFDYKDIGFISRKELPYFYSVSSIFVSTSVNDAGPSTLKQSLACGTPLVSFEMGAALDVLKDKGTGYCAKLRDSEDLANGILSIMRMSKSEYMTLRRHCREFVVKNSSRRDFVEALFV